MRKSCENGPIFTKFRFLKIFRFHENLIKFDSAYGDIFLHSITFWEDKKNICVVMLEFSCH
jgi:hypothetical protein